MGPSFCLTMSLWMAYLGPPMQTIIIMNCLRCFWRDVVYQLLLIWTWFTTFLFSSGKVWSGPAGLRSSTGSVWGKLPSAVQEGTLFKGAWAVQRGLQVHHRMSAHSSAGKGIKSELRGYNNTALYRMWNLRFLKLNFKSKSIEDDFVSVRLVSCI